MTNTSNPRWNRRIRTGLLTAALAGGTILGATQVAGAVNAQTDDEPTEQPTDPADVEADAGHEARHGERRQARQADAQEIAELLGVDSEALHEQLHEEGATLAGIAEANGVAVDSVVDLLVEQQNERLDAAVEAGRLDAAEADEKRAEIEERVTTRVNEGRPEGGEGRGKHGHRRGGPGGHHGEAPADAPADVEIPGTTES